VIALEDGDVDPAEPVVWSGRFGGKLSGQRIGEADAGLRVVDPGKAVLGEDCGIASNADGEATQVALEVEIALSASDAAEFYRRHGVLSELVLHVAQDTLLLCAGELGC